MEIIWLLMRKRERNRIDIIVEINIIKVNFIKWLKIGDVLCFLNVVNNIDKEIGFRSEGVGLGFYLGSC